MVKFFLKFEPYNNALKRNNNVEISIQIITINTPFAILSLIAYNKFILIAKTNV